MTRLWALVMLLAACGSASAEPDGAEHHHAANHPGADVHHGGGHHGGGHHDFSDAESFAELFDAPDRDEWQRPAHVVELLELEPGMVVADIGAGTGYFLPHLATAVGQEGRVLGLDVETAMVDWMQRRIARDSIPNTEARQCPMDSPGLAPASVDRILIVNTWHHIQDREAYAAKLLEALRPGGFVLVVDFTLESAHGPPREMRLGFRRVMVELTEGGLNADLVTEELPMQWVVKGARGGA